jgi:D-alanine-D-alanine ligase
MAMISGKAGNRVRLGVLFGGKSGEHEVSISSAASVMAALHKDEYEVTAIGITRTGLLADRNQMQRMLPAALMERVRMHPNCDDCSSMPLSGALSADRWAPGEVPEIIFPLLHGPFGEDGTIQGLLEIAGLPYIGCGVLASAVGMDKDFMKRMFALDALPVVPFRVEHARSLRERMARLREEVERDFGFPVFSKPANLGSSVGVIKIHDAREFDDAILSSARFDRKIIIEKAVEAREMECAVLGNDDPEASVVGEVVPACEFYDYEAKYNNPNSRTLIPADIPPEKMLEIRQLALRAFQSIGGSGLARVDFFLDRHTDSVWVNEINTMPGFTSISMYPKLWDASGVPFDRLIRRLVELGLERHAERSGLADTVEAAPPG